MDTLQLKASWKGVASVLKWQVEERFHVILTRIITGICKQGKKGFLAKTTRSFEYTIRSQNETCGCAKSSILDT